MARKPKTQPSPDDTVPILEDAAPYEVAPPARRGRKPKAAALSFASPPAASIGSPAMGDVGTGVPQADPTKVPGRKGPGRKPKQAVGAEVAPLLQNGAAEPQSQAPGQPATEASSNLAGDDVSAAAAVPQAETAADNEPARLADEAAQSVPEAEASVPAAPAAHWDRTTDRVQFDWPAIERVAAQGGPNQGMATLLVAARAEGAGSRWPF